MKRNALTRKEKYKDYRESMVSGIDKEHVSSEVKVEQKPRLNELIVEFKKKKRIRYICYYTAVSIFSAGIVALFIYLGLVIL